MKRKRVGWILGVTAVLLLGGALLTVLSGRVTLIGEQHNPDGMFALRYYRVFHPLRMVWSMPGDSACEPRSARLFAKDGSELNGMQTTSCDLENQPRWLETELVLPDGKTVWQLPPRTP